MKEHQKKFWIILIAITLVALGIRLLAGWQMYNSVPGVTEPSTDTDMETYIRYGQQFKDGTYTDFDGAYYYQPFYSAVYLNILFRVFGDSILAIVISQAFLGALTVLLTGLIGSLLGGRKVGVWSAVILALFRNHILYTPYALIAILQTFLITLTIYLIILGLRRESYKYWAMAGLAASCSILCRGNFLLIVPFVLIIVYWRFRNNTKKALLSCGLFLIMVYIPQLPFSVKNYQVTGKWTGPSTAGGVVLGIGNNPDASPGTLNIAGSHYFHFDEGDEISHWRSLEPEVPIKDSIKFWILDNPSQWLELKFRTFILYLSDEECYNNITLAENVKYVPWLNSYFLLDYWLVGLPFISYLLFRIFRIRTWKYNLILITTLIYILSTVLFYILSRYKLPVIPLMSVMALLEVRRWKIELKSNDNARRLKTLILIFISTYGVTSIVYLYQDSFESKVMKNILPEGNSFVTDKAYFVKDHSPNLRGGWDPVELQPNDSISKTFTILDKELDGNHGELRVFCGIESDLPLPLELTVEHVGKHYKTQQVFSSGWLKVKIGKVNLAKPFNLYFRSPGKAAMFFTPQRNYQRSMLNGQKIDGEWIMQLKVFKEK